MKIIYLFDEIEGRDFSVWSSILDFANYFKGYACETEIWYSGQKMSWESESATLVHLPSRQKKDLIEMILSRQLSRDYVLFMTGSKSGSPEFWGAELHRRGFAWMNLLETGFLTKKRQGNSPSLRYKRNRYVFYEEPNGSLDNILEMVLAWQYSKFRMASDFKLIIASNGAPEHEWQVMAALLELPYNHQIEYVGRLSGEGRREWLNKAEVYRTGKRTELIPF